jgi:hypothetical protein
MCVFADLVCVYETVSLYSIHRADLAWSHAGETWLSAVMQTSTAAPCQGHSFGDPLARIITKITSPVSWLSSTGQSAFKGKVGYFVSGHWLSGVQFQKWSSVLHRGLSDWEEQVVHCGSQWVWQCLVMMSEWPPL